MDHTFLIAAAIACVSLLYAMAGQSGGTAFLAIMAFAAFPAVEMRATALLLNIIAAGYATWRLHRREAIDRRLLLHMTLPSLIAAFAGGLLVLDGRAYLILTGLLLVIAAGVILLRRAADTLEARPVHFIHAGLVGTGAGFISGLTGVGGGVYLTPMIIGLGWVSPRRAAALTPPFILCNSVLGLAGVLLAGQRLVTGATLYAIGALVGAMVGTAIGIRWMSERATRYVLAVILLLAGLRLIFH